MKKLFVGFDHIMINGNQYESLDKLIFVNSTSNGDNKTLFFKIDNYKSKDKLEKDLFNFLKKNRVDMILFNLINDEIKEDTLKTLKKTYLTLNWFGDDQWRFESFSKYKCNLFSYSVTTDKNAFSKYKSIGYNNVILSQWAALEIINKKVSSYSYDISFVGSYSTAREWLILKLKKNNLNVNVFGSGWGNDSFLTYEDFKNVVLNSKINLNLSNSSPKNLNFIFFFFKNFFSEIFLFKKSFKNLIKLLKAIKLNFFYSKNFEQIKARNFEIPALNGFQLTNRVEGLDEFFIENKEIVFFDDDNDLIEKCKFYLSNDSIRERIKQASNKKSFNHTYKKRFEEIFEKLNDFN